MRTHILLLITLVYSGVYGENDSGCSVQRDATTPTCTTGWSSWTTCPKVDDSVDSAISLYKQQINDYGCKVLFNHNSLYLITATFRCRLHSGQQP